MAIDLSTLSAPNLPTPPPEALMPPVVPPQLGGPDAPDTGINPATPPTPPRGGTPVGTPNPPKHAALLSMIQGLAVGLSAAGTSIASHGERGGAPEVQEYQAKQQEMKIQQQQAATEQKNAALQQSIAQEDLNAKTFTNHMNLLAAPEKIAQEHLTTTQGKQAVISGAQDIRTKALQDFVMTGDLAAYNKTLSELDTAAGASPNGRTSATPPGTPNVIPGVTPAGAPAGTIPPVAIAQWKNSTDAAVSAYPNDPDIKQYAAILANPNSTPTAMASAANAAKNRMSALDAGVASQTKQQAAAETAPLGTKADQINAMTERRYQILNPGKSLPDEYKVTPQMTPVDAKRIDDSLKQTEDAQSVVANRQLTNEIHEQTLNLLRGPQGISPDAVGPEYLKQVRTVDPGQADLIEGYGQGRLTLSPNIARTPQGVALTKEILRAYPQYQQAKAEGYNKQYLNFTEGKVGTAVNSYSTSLDHLNDMFDNVANASAADLNLPTSKIHQQLDVDKNVISSELAKAVSNGSMTEGEKDQMLAAVDGKILGIATKDKYQNQLREVVRLLAGKLNAYQSQWASTAVPGSEPPSNLVDAANATKKLAGTASSGKSVSLAAAMKLPINAGKTADQVRADIIAHGHEVGQ